MAGQLIALDIGSNFGKTVYGPPPSQYVCDVVLVANVAQQITVPTGAQWVNFASDSIFWANFLTTATVPNATINDGTASRLNPGMVFIGNNIQSTGATEAITTISVISNVAAHVNMSFYS